MHTHANFEESATNNKPSQTQLCPLAMENFPKGDNPNIIQDISKTFFSSSFNKFIMQLIFKYINKYNQFTYLNMNSITIIYVNILCICVNFKTRNNIGMKSIKIYILNQYIFYIHISNPKPRKLCQNLQLT